MNILRSSVQGRSVIQLCLCCRECYENNGLYHALQLETMFNINSFLNRTVVSERLKETYTKRE